jgi:DNA modification methylase
MKNTLYYGDNLEVLRDSINDESVDLVYLDPPFNSNSGYNVLFKEPQGGNSNAQIQAFEDTWHWGDDDEIALDRMTTKNGELAEVLLLMVKALGKNDLAAYLVMMAERLLELHRVLKPTGSLYLHCDPTASHYLKFIIFGPKSYRNEIIWKRTSAHSDANRWGSVHDTILFYTKSEEYQWNTVFTPYDEEYLETFLDSVDEAGKAYKRSDLTGAGVSQGQSGEPWKGINVSSRGRHWAVPTKPLLKFATREEVNQMSVHQKLDLLDSFGRIHWPKKADGMPRLKQYLEDLDGIPIQDMITDIRPIHNLSHERLGYPTQKPLTLLERIITASSNLGDIILDPFCGCGTAVIAAQKLRRKWIGIDITHLAVDVMQRRLKRDFDLNEGRDYLVIGTPRDHQGAKDLFNRDPYQFQFWAISLLDAQPYGAGASRKGKKGGDTGIDGLLYFRTPGGEKLEKTVISVKGGKNLQPTMLRDLLGTIQREKAALGVFLTLHDVTAGMKAEAAKAGVYKYGGKTYPKIQIITVRELLEGKRPQLPEGSSNVSLEQKVKTAPKQQGGLFTEATL